MTSATTQADGPADTAALNGVAANNNTFPSLLSAPISPASTVHTAAPPQPLEQLAEAKTDAEAQQIATSRALAKAKEILQGGGTQSEAAEAAKIVAREILREFQLVKQTRKRQSGLGEMDADVVNKSEKPRKMKLLSSHLQSNGHHVPSTFKKFWRKSRKNKANEKNGSADEARDDEGDEQPAQVGAGSNHLVTVIPMITTPQEDRYPAVEVRDGVESTHSTHSNDKDVDEPLNQPSVNNGIHDVASQILDSNIASADSNSKANRILKKEESSTPNTSEEPKKQQRKTTSSNIVSSSQPQHRPPSVRKTHNNNERFSQTYSNESSDSDNYSYNEYDSYPHHNQGGHIYLDDNESVSVLTKEYLRDPNIMDVLSLEAVMEVVNKGIIMREDDEMPGSRKHHSRLKNGSLKEDDENSVDRFLFSLWNALDCCGQNSEVAFNEKSRHLGRCHRVSGSSGHGGFHHEITLDSNGQHFDYQRRNKRNVGGSGSAEKVDGDLEPDRTRPDNSLNGAGKSVSWADDTVDNILLPVSARGDGRDEKQSVKQEFHLSRSNSSDGKGSKSSVRSAVKSSLKNMKNIMSNIQCAALASMNNGEVDANSIYEQHRNAMKAGNSVDNTVTNGDNVNWREMVNSVNTDPNWRAMVNDRLNYQGPNSPASSAAGGLTSGGGLFSMMNGQPQQQLQFPPQAGVPLSNQGSVPGQQQPWEGNPSMWNLTSQHPVTGGFPLRHVDVDSNVSSMPLSGRIPSGLNMDPNIPPSTTMARIPSSHYPALDNLPSRPMAMVGRFPSIGHHSVNASSNVMNLSLSIDSDDDTMDKYAGMEGEMEAQRAIPNRANAYPSPTQQLVAQDSEIIMDDRYSGAPSRVMGVKYMDSKADDPRTNNAHMRQQDVTVYGNNGMFQPPFHSNGTAAAYGNYAQFLSHKDLILPPTALGVQTGNEMIYSQTTRQEQPTAAYGQNHPQLQYPMSQLPQSPRRTFMA